jgi:fucose permease
MSTIYPTLNSKGMSCFPRTQHGAAAGVLLCFTVVAAAITSFAMGAVSDAYGDVRFGFMLATVFAFLLCAGLLYNWIVDPAHKRFATVGASDYGTSSVPGKI